MKNAYLLSLEQQIAEQQQRKLREAEQERDRDRADAVRASAPAALGVLGSPSRGGGGEPLRDADGRVLSGVRGLFHRELLGAPLPSAQRHSAGAGGDEQPPRARQATNNRLATCATGRGGLRDPNAGHHIFGSPAEAALCGIYGDRLPPPARGAAHREPFDMSALPRPRTESLRPAPDSRRAPALPWPEPLATGGQRHRGARRHAGDEDAAGRATRQRDGEGMWEKRARGYREQAPRRRPPSDDEDSAEHLDSSRTLSIPSPRPCASSPWGRGDWRDHTPPLLVDESRPAAGPAVHGGAPVPLRGQTQADASGGGGAAAGGVAACREWVEALVLDRERLRQQLRDAGLDPCC